MSRLTHTHTHTHARRSEHDRRADLMREQEYSAHAATVDRYLAGTYGAAFTASEREEIRQDAFTGVEGERAKGTEIDNTEALLITCARNAANSRLRSADRRRRYTFDPQDSPEARTADPGLPLDVSVVDADENRRMKMLMEQLDDRSRNVLKLRLELELDGPEIADYLGVSKSHAYKLLKRAGRALADAIAVDEAGGHSAKQRALLAACEMGTATPEQRRLAEQLLEDPHVRTLLAELRGLGHQAAAFLPLPTTAAAAGPPSSGRVSQMLSSAKQHVGDLFTRAPSQDVTTQVAASGGVRGSGSAALAVVGCVAGLTGTGVVVKECIDRGIPARLVDALPVVNDEKQDDSAEQPAAEQQPVIIEQAPVVVETTPATAPDASVIQADPQTETTQSSSKPNPLPATGADSVSGLSGNPTPDPAPAPSSPSAVPSGVASPSGGTDGSGDPGTALGGGL